MADAAQNMSLIRTESRKVSQKNMYVNSTGICKLLAKYLNKVFRNITEHCLFFESERTSWCLISQSGIFTWHPKAHYLTRSKFMVSARRMMADIAQKYREIWFRSRQNLPFEKTFYRGPNTHIAATTWNIGINTL